MPQQHNVIRSFVLRQGRVSNAQRRAYEDLLPKYGVPYTKDLLNFEIVYGREPQDTLK